MNVLIDTPIWSLALRRRRAQLSLTDRRLVAAWVDLVRENRVSLIGPIRQELLSGLADARSFERLRDHLRAFDDEPLNVEDFEEAASFANLCRSRGVAGSSVDFLICSTASRRDLPIFTTDRDFARYASHLPIHLYHA